MQPGGRSCCGSWPGMKNLEKERKKEGRSQESFERGTLWAKT